jgi:hypothetical protein
MEYTDVKRPFYFLGVSAHPIDHPAALLLERAHLDFCCCFVLLL